jgi:hypothetical protein
VVFDAEAKNYWLCILAGNPQYMARLPGAWYWGYAELGFDWV